jgi:type I restriction-modification system DNA methylase subunit
VSRILLALYLRKEKKLHIVENFIPENSTDNLIWGWESGADKGYAEITFTNETLERWERDGVNNICIVGDISDDKDLTKIVEVFKRETASDNERSILFAPQWEPAFLLDVTNILLNIDDDKFKYSQFDEIFDNLLIRIFAQSQFRGEFIQPKELSSLVISLSHEFKSSNTIYNPCCGVGTYITSDVPSWNYVGEEINPVIFAIALLRMKWYEYTDCTSIILGDSLHSSVMNFDAIVSTPPFESVSPSKLDGSIMASLINKCITNKKPGIFIVPAGFCLSHTYKRLRQNLIDQNAIKGVILLPSGLFAPYSGIQTAIIVINPNSEEGVQKVKLMDATSFMDAKTSKLKENEILSAWKEDSECKVMVDNDVIIERDFDLCPNSYLDLNIEVPNGAKLLLLNEIGCFIKTYDRESRENVRWATLSSFTNPNILKTYSASEIQQSKSMQNSLVIDKDCILISATGGRGISLHIDENGPIYTHHNNAAFIPDESIILPQYLILELAKPYMANKSLNYGTIVPRRNAGCLKVIVPSIEEQKKQLANTNLSC